MEKAVEVQSISSNPGLNPPESDCGPEWLDLIVRIRNGDASAQEAIYLLLHQGVRFLLLRHFGPEALDELHEVFVIIVTAIRTGRLRDPERLPAFVRGVVKRRVALRIRQSIRCRKLHGELSEDLFEATQPVEEKLSSEEELDAMWETLHQLSQRDREVLVRSYLREEPPESICADMGLTPTQFRLLKSRAKTRFAALARRKQAQKKLVAYATRAMAFKSAG
jgi:RNA polymerase sigma factor (sigma-70 family)